jgi:hypothetical protein
MENNKSILQKRRVEHTLLETKDRGWKKSSIRCPKHRDEELVLLFSVVQYDKY